jgi:heme-degrading monooxygenase HmoA
MFARVQTVHQPAEKLDEITKLAQEQLPAARELSGFHGFYFLIDRDNGKALVISLWETEEDLSQVEVNTPRRERTAAKAGIKSPPSEVFEVALRAVGRGSGPEDSSSPASPKATQGSNTKLSARIAPLWAMPTWADGARLDGRRTQSPIRLARPGRPTATDKDVLSIMVQCIPPRAARAGRDLTTTRR